MNNSQTRGTPALRATIAGLSSEEALARMRGYSEQWEDWVQQTPQ